MSKPSDFELDLDLQLLPEWARQSSTENRYSEYKGDSDGDRRGRRQGPRDRPRRPGGGPRPGPRPDRRPPSGREGARGGDQRQRGEGYRGRSDRRPPHREPEIPLPELDTRFIPEPKGVESLAHQIKLTGRAYPLFEIAWLVLRKPGRYSVEFKTRRDAEGKPIQPLFVCSLDNSIWLSQDELATHALRAHFDTFYQTEKTPTDPPKGTYTFVAKCGMSGVILGPPNYHDYQPKLRRLHSERFSRMPFEAFKSRVEIVKDEEVVKKWIEDQSYKTSYIGLNVPEQVTLESREEVEKHFRETHLPNISKSVDTAAQPLGGPQVAMSRDLGLLLRQSTEQQRRFPLKLATALSQAFASHGLQFFKVNKTVTHVCVARPHYLDLKNVIVSDGVRRIVEYIDTHEGCSRRTLLETLAPAPIPAPVPSPPPTAESTASPAPPDQPPESKAADQETPPAPPTEGTPEKATAPVSSTPTPEQTAVITDLHWLIHQGHVIEFSDGHMETAKQPRERPPQPKPKPKPAPAKTHPEQQESKTTTETAPATPVDEGGKEPPASDTKTEPEPVSSAPVTGTPAGSPETNPAEQPVPAVASETESRIHAEPEPERAAETETAPDSAPPPAAPKASVPEPNVQRQEAKPVPTPPPAPVDPGDQAEVVPEAEAKPEPADEIETPEKRPDVGL